MYMKFIKCVTTNKCASTVQCCAPSQKMRYPTSTTCSHFHHTSRKVKAMFSIYTMTTYVRGWRYSSMYSLPWYQIKGSSQLHAPTALTLCEELPVSTEQVGLRTSHDALEKRNSLYPAPARNFVQLPSDSACS